MSFRYVPFWHVPLMMQSHAMEGVQWLTTQPKYERQQDNSDKRSLARQHPSDLLHSLTCEWDRQRIVLSRPCYELRHNIFVQLNFPHARREAQDVHDIPSLLFILFAHINAFKILHYLYSIQVFFIVTSYTSFHYGPSSIWLFSSGQLCLLSSTNPSRMTDI